LRQQFRRKGRLVIFNRFSAAILSVHNEITTDLYWACWPKALPVAEVDQFATIQ
jgi:hypothetical protein